MTAVPSRLFASGTIFEDITVCYEQHVLPLAGTVMFTGSQRALVNTGYSRRDGMITTKRLLDFRNEKF
ncbi:hypothetical protein N7452_002894 [Penicillium brevicompactum]|uniref:Uncharacterized protein n=1 Tax=Penicillium brevicompactum TaxID=5074 RepID=A0A9W9ULY1_PENBR|nr:hypothetical protein N7452_002894 [Penicillium brevicompactum]